MLPRLSFTVDGSPIDLSEFSFSSSADLGYDQFRAAATNVRARKIVGGIAQGSIIRAYTEEGAKVWEGTVPQAPKLRQDGVAAFAAQGYAYRAAKSGNRITPIIDAPGAWIPANLEPVNYPLTADFAADPVYTNTLSERSIAFGAASASGDELGLAFYGRGMNITRLTATLSNPPGGAHSSTLWRVLTATLPNTFETRRVEYVVDLASTVNLRGTGNPFYRHRTFDASVTFPPSDVVIIELFHPNANVATSTVTITDPRVYGDYEDVVIYTDQAARIVAHQLGWDESGVTGVGAAPLTSSDWVGDGASYMNYIAGLEDFCWGVWADEGNGPLLTYGPYGRRTWEVSAATGATWDLEPLERVRKITVQYLNVDSTLAEATLEADEFAGLPDSVATELKGSLQDNQTGSALAYMTAWRALQRFLAARYRGRIAFFRAFEEGSRRDAPYEVRGGDLIRIVDFSLDGAITLRVHSVEDTADGVVVGIEAPALPLGGSIRGSAGTRPGVAPVATVTGGVPVYVAPGTSAGASGGGGTDTIPDAPGAGGKGGIDLGKYGK